MTNFYKTARWVSKRKKILKRDEYQCQECKRFGKNVEARIVHHIQPLLVRPDLRLDSLNLVSLCFKCHENMHDRSMDKLTDLGLYWVERIERKRNA